MTIDEVDSAGVPPPELPAWSSSLLPPDHPREVAARLLSLCAGVSSALNFEGAAIEVMSAQGAEAIAAASDDGARARAHVSLDTGEGPTWEAFERGRPVLVADLSVGAGTRWLAYSPAAQAAGIEAVFAFPLQVGVERFGVLTAFDSSPRHLGYIEINKCLAVAELATEVLLDSAEKSADGEIAPDLKGALGFRSEVYQAQGMVAVALQTSIGAAMARMRAHAFASDRDLTAVALDIVERRLHLEQDPRDPHAPPDPWRTP